MISIAALELWLDTLDASSSIAIEENGLTLIEVDEDGTITGAYLEIGGEED